MQLITYAKHNFKSLKACNSCAAYLLYSSVHTCLAFLNWWVFDIINFFSSTQLSQDFKVSNGGRDHIRNFQLK